MKQQTLAMAAVQGFERHRKPTRRDAFLETMNRVVPWEALCAVIEPYYPKKGNGRPPIGLERMLRIHFLQHWFNLADLACEEALYDSASLRRFAGIDLGCEAVPDATTMLKFRRLLEQHKLAERLFAEVGRVLQGSGMTLKTGTIVDATIIAAPSSTKNADKQRDPEMHQTRKGQQWYFGMKLHIGVDSQSGLAHSAVVTPANIHDKHPLPERTDSGQGAKGKGFYERACTQSRPSRRSKTGKESQQVQNPGPGRTCVCRGQATVGLYQGALSRLGQECQPGLYGAGLG
jgi:IS5 family transposase